MCIVNGGVKVSLKGKGRMRNLVRYECKAKGCGKLWGLMRDGIIVTGSPPKFCGYDRRGYKKFRKEGHCDCGEPFDYPHIYVNVEQTIE